jgi:hypothetical protein
VRIPHRLSSPMPPAPLPPPARSTVPARVVAPVAVALVEPLEARRLMHAGHEHVDAPGRAAAANPAGSLFVDAGNVKAPFTDAAGTTVWGADVLAIGGKPARGKFAVAGTDDDALFASRRQGKVFAYNAPNVPDGAYTLSLLFVDTQKKPGKRLFNVVAQGQTLESNLDIVARAGGPRVALVLTHDVTVTGGTFDLAFTRGAKGQAVVSAFSLVPASPVGRPAPGRGT